MPNFARLLDNRSIPWLIVHRLGKSLIINSVAHLRTLLKNGGKPSEVLKDSMVVDSLGYVRDMFADVLNNKNTHGWVNPEAKLLYDILSEIIKRDEILRKGDDDHIKRMWMNIRDITCVVMDEDTHYMLRVLYLVELLNKMYPEFRIQSHRNRAYWNWDTLYAQLQKEMENDKDAPLKEWLSKGNGDNLPDNTGSSGVN